MRPPPQIEGVWFQSGTNNDASCLKYDEDEEEEKEYNEEEEEEEEEKPKAKRIIYPPGYSGEV